MTSMLSKLARLTVLLLFPAAVQAAPVFHYTYVSGVLDEPFGMEGDPAYTSKRFTIEFWAPAPLATGYLPLEGLRARGTVPGMLDMEFPSPPLPPLCYPDDWSCVEEWPDHIEHVTFRLYVEALGQDGFPTRYTMGMGQESIWWGEGNGSIGMHTEGYDGSIMDAIGSVGPRGSNPILHGWNISEPGQWTLAITEIPLPGTMVLALAGLAALGFRRRLAITTETPVMSLPAREL